MKRVEAEKLLGGYATGILTEAERKRLFAAALDRQDLFDALMDEEALRELLADPASKAQLIRALAPAPAKIILFWRHPGLLSAAAGLILASVAGLAYLRSPDQAPRALKEEGAKAPVLKALEAPTPVAPPAQASAPAETKATQAPPAKAKVSAKEVAIPLQAAESPAPEPRAEAKAQPAYGMPGGVMGGVVGGVMGKVEPARRADGAAAAPATAAAAADDAQARRQAFQRDEARNDLAKQAKKAEAPRPAAAAAVEVVASAGLAGLVPEPAWTLAPMADGHTRVTVTAARGLQVLLLKRGFTGVEVLKLQPGPDSQGPGIRWTSLVRLAPGDVLDLYTLEGPVPDPAQLPETGPVGGFRARIHPAAKKDPTR